MQLDSYKDRFEHVVIERDSDGVVLVRFHTDGGPMYWSEKAHSELPELFYALGEDTENRVVVLTGTGDAFCAGTAQGNFKYTTDLPPVALDKIYREGRALLRNYVNLPVPVIAAVRGNAISHPELALLADIVIASPDAVFQDRHLSRGIVPGDGIHIVFPLVFGATRGRYLALTSKPVSAKDALEWGAVSEIVGADHVLARARELALELARQPILGLRYTRELLNVEIARLMEAHLGHGLALEGFASGYGAWDGALNE